MGKPISKLKGVGTLINKQEVVCSSILVVVMVTATTFAKGEIVNFKTTVSKMA